MVFFFNDWTLHVAWSRRFSSQTTKLSAISSFFTLIQRPIQDCATNSKVFVLHCRESTFRTRKLVEHKTHIINQGFQINFHLWPLFRGYQSFMTYEIVQCAIRNLPKFITSFLWTSYIRSNSSGMYDVLWLWCSCSKSRMACDKD